MPARCRDLYCIALQRGYMHHLQCCLGGKCLLTLPTPPTFGHKPDADRYFSLSALTQTERHACFFQKAAILQKPFPKTDIRSPACERISRCVQSLARNAQTIL